MLNEGEKQRLAELYNTAYETFFSQSTQAKAARVELNDWLNELHQRECPNLPFREFRNGCFQMAKQWLKVNQPNYPFLH
jgi:hypothetical protein